MSSNPILVIVIGVVLVGALVLFSGGEQKTATDTSDGVTNVTMVDGTQIITITAKGGYAPATSTAKAGIPTILRFKTSGSYDCSSSILIPSLKISKDLPATGTTDVDIGSLTPGTLSGTCSMGMYRFSVVAGS